MPNIVIRLAVTDKEELERALLNILENVSNENVSPQQIIHPSGRVVGIYERVRDPILNPLFDFNHPDPIKEIAENRFNIDEV